MCCVTIVCRLLKCLNFHNHHLKKTSDIFSKAGCLFFNKYLSFSSSSSLRLYMSFSLVSFLTLHLHFLLSVFVLLSLFFFFFVVVVFSLFLNVIFFSFFIFDSSFVFQKMRATCNRVTRQLQI